MTGREGGRSLLPFVSAVSLTCAFLALQAVTAAAAHRGHSYVGRTAQGQRIQLAVHGRRVGLLHVTVRLRCRDRSILVDDESGFQPTPIRANGRFRDHQSGSTDDVYLSGRLRGRVLRGRVRVTDRVGRVRCNSRGVRFTARRS